MVTTMERVKSWVVGWANANLYTRTLFHKERNSSHPRKYLPILTNGDGYVDPSFYNLSDTISTGTWTPTVEDAVSGGNVASLGTALGWYTRVSNLWFVTCTLGSINTTGMTAGNSVFIHGLPVAAMTATNLLMFGSVNLVNVAFSGYVVARIQSGVQFMGLWEHTSGGATETIKVSDLTSGSAGIRVSITYLADDTV